MRLLIAVDYWFQGRRTKILTSLAGFQVLIAPLLDRRLMGDTRVAANLEFFTFFATAIFTTTAMLALVARLAALSESPVDAIAKFDPIQAAVAAGHRLAVYSALVRTMSWRSVAVRVLGTVAVGLFAARGSVGLARWFVWNALDLVERVVGSGAAIHWGRSLLEWVYFREQQAADLAVLTLIVACLALLPSILARRETSEFGSLIADRAPIRAIYPEIVRVHPSAGGPMLSAFQGEIVHRFVNSVTTWRSPFPTANEAVVGISIEGHLRQLGHQVEGQFHARDRHGLVKIDFVVDERIAVELKVNLHEKGASERDRAIEQVRRYAVIWRDRGPVFLLLIGTPQPDATRFSQAAFDWNRAAAAGQAPLMVICEAPPVPLSAAAST